MTNGSCFAGVEGFGLGAALSGIPTKWTIELEEFRNKVIRKNFKHNEMYTDIRDVENPGYVDIISGGFPCQDISIAGKGTGIKGERSGLWSEMYRICGEVRPMYLLLENSPMLLSRGFERILCDLSKIGYDAEWQCLSGKTFGIQQNRERLYCIAYPHKKQRKGRISKSVFRKPYLQRELRRIYPGWKTRWEIPQPRSYGATNVIPNQLDRVAAIGDSVQPVVAYYLYQSILNHAA